MTSVRPGFPPKRFSCKHSNNSVKFSAHFRFPYCCLKSRFKVGQDTVEHCAYAIEKKGRKSVY